MARPSVLPADASAEVTGRVSSPFRVLRHPNFRYLWFGTLVSSSGDWMDLIALNWLVLTMTDSPVWLGILAVARSAPLLVFTLLGGVAADRFERRRLMIVTQSVAMVLAFTLAALAIVAGPIWLIILVATLRGIMLSFNMPARQALISELAPREELTAAISLNSATLNITRVIGPTVGGLLIAVVGVAGAFVFNGLSFLAVIYALLKMRDLPPMTASSEPVLRAMREGVHFVWRDHTIRSLLLVALVPLTLGMAYQPMLTVFARDVLSIGTAGLGALTSAAGLGAVIGALVTGAVAGNLAPRGWLMFGGTVLFGVALASFALSTLPLVSVATLVVLGMGSSMSLATNNALLQEFSPDEMRGRVMSMMFLTRGLIPLGALVAGVGAEVVGAPATMAAFGVAMVLITAVAATLSPQVRVIR